MTWKYIIVQYNGYELPIIFPRVMMHDEMFNLSVLYFVRQARQLFGDETSDELIDAVRVGVRLVAAGSLELKAETAGSFSITTGLSPREGDVDFINTMSRHNGLLGAGAT